MRLVQQLAGAVLLVITLISLPVWAAKIALTNVNLADVESLTIKPSQTILLQDDTISAILPASQPIPASYVQIDLAGKYVLPGLIDAHVHHATEPEGYNNADITRLRLQKLLRGGVTSVRDMAGDVRVLAGLKRSAQLDLIQAPDIYYSVILGGKSFFSDPRTAAAAKGEIPGETDWMRSVDDKTDVDALMQRVLGTGATGIKIYADVPASIVKPLADAAKKAGLKVWSHAYIGPDKPSAVVAAGVEVISHIPDLSAEVIPDYKAWRRKDGSISEAVKAASFDSINYHSLLRSIQQQGIVLDATLTVFEQHRDKGPNRELMFQHGIFLTKLALKQGITLAAGTDTFDDAAPLPMLHHELKLLVELAGLTPAQALQAATLNSAKTIGIAAKAGSVAVGKVANLLIVNADPFADISHSSDIAYVIKNGRFIDRGTGQRLPVAANNGALQPPAAEFNWPNGAKAAVSLAYDDTLASQLDVALVQLNQHQLKASFYLQLSSPLLTARLSEWRAAAAQGHELGNHTLFHQCSASKPGRDWVAAENDLDNISAVQLVQQIRLANSMLFAIDGKTERTFTAPCGDGLAGGQSYLPLIYDDFIAIKAKTGPVVTTMAQLNVHAVDVIAPVGSSGSELIALVKQAAQYGTMVNFTFHGIGGDHLSVSADAHAELLAYLAANRDTYWTDTFINIMQYVKAN